MRLWYTSTVKVPSSFKTGGALPTVQLWNSWEIFTLALEAHEVLGQIPSMCLNGENDPFPNYPFKGGDQRCEIVSYQMDRSAASGALQTSSNWRLWSRLWTTVERWCLLFRLGTCLNFPKQGIEATYSNCNLINENCPICVFNATSNIFKNNKRKRKKKAHGLQVAPFYTWTTFQNGDLWNPIYIKLTKMRVTHQQQSSLSRCFDLEQMTFLRPLFM